MENKQIKFSSKEVILGDNIDIEIVDLEPKKKYSIYLQSIYDSDYIYYSSAEFYSDSSGKISIDTSQSIGGDFLGLDSLGLFSTIGYDGNSPSFLKINEQEISNKKLENCIYVVLDDKIIIKESFHFIYQSKAVEKIEIREKGIKTDLYLANSTKNLIVVLGGSEGDLDASTSSAQVLASKGYNACVVSYFGAEGQRKKMTKIPIEIIDSSLFIVEEKLGKIDNLYIYGASKGAELALVYASLRSKVKGVIAISPSSVVLQTFNMSPFSTWTSNGEELDYMTYSYNGSSKFDEYDKKIYEHYYYPYLDTVKESAKIKVENIQGDILLFSGKDDKLWPSAYMSDMIEERISNHEFKYIFKNYQYENVGHFLGIPYQPITIHEYYAIGGQQKENAYAYLDSWNKILEYLNSKSIKN